jgi:uncharacterized lipoprotein YajG
VKNLNVADTQNKFFNVIPFNFINFFYYTLFCTLFLFQLTGCSKSVNIEDFCGVWRGDSDGAMVEINLESDTPSITINNQRFDVAIKEIDNDNHILSLKVNNSNITWSIKQVFEDKDHNKFTLDMTLQDGTNDSLSFVRNL